MAFDGSLPGPQGGGGRAWRRSEAAWLHLQNAHPAGTCHGFTLHCSISPLRAARKGGKVRPVAQSEAIQITLVCPDLSRARSTCGCAAGKNGCYDTANPGARNRAGVVRRRGEKKRGLVCQAFLRRRRKRPVSPQDQPLMRSASTIQMTAKAL